MSRGRARQHHIPINELRRLYVDNLWSSYQLAEHFNCSAPTIFSRLKEAGIPARKVGNAVRGKPQQHVIPLGELTRLYVDEKWSADRLAEKYSCSGPTIYNRLREAGVDVRKCNDTKRGVPSPHRKKPPISEAAIIAAYRHRPTMGISELGRLLGCSGRLIGRVLDDYGIPHKSLSQVIVGKRNGPSNPNWRDDLTPEDRARVRDNAKTVRWRTEVYIRDGFACIKCDDATGGNLNAHHIESYNSRSDLRWNVDNGVTLCETCHRAFHKRFGYGGNNASQLAEFLSHERLVA